MKNKKIIVLIVLIIILIVAIIVVFKPEKEELKHTKPVEPTYVIDLPEYSRLKDAKIKEARIIRYTEGGSEEKAAEGEEEIKRIYDRVAKLKITDETDQTCTDNTTVFEFITEEGVAIDVEIECDWLVLGNKHFLISE